MPGPRIALFDTLFGFPLQAGKVARPTFFKGGFSGFVPTCVPLDAFRSDGHESFCLLTPMSHLPQVLLRFGSLICIFVFYLLNPSSKV